MCTSVHTNTFINTVCPVGCLDTPMQIFLLMITGPNPLPASTWRQHSNIINGLVQLLRDFYRNLFDRYWVAAVCCHNKYQHQDMNIRRQLNIVNTTAPAVVQKDRQITLWLHMKWKEACVVSVRFIWMFISLYCHSCGVRTSTYVRMCVATQMSTIHAVCKCCMHVWMCVCVNLMSYKCMCFVIYACVYVQIRLLVNLP